MRYALDPWNPYSLLTLKLIFHHVVFHNRKWIVDIRQIKLSSTGIKNPVDNPYKYRRLDTRLSF